MITKNGKHYSAQGHRSRLRQRFLNAGESSVADYEVLEMLLYACNARKDTKPLAKKLLAQFNNFASMVNADIAELKQIEGVNDSVVATIKAVLQASNLIHKSNITQKPVLENWQALINYCQASMGHVRHEQYKAIYLDSKNMIIREDTCDGTANKIAIYPREIIKNALYTGAVGLILVHNHPSEIVQPSKHDVIVTNNLLKAAKLVDVTMHDHVIVSRNLHFSFKHHGLI